MIDLTYNKNIKYGRPITQEDLQSCNDTGVIHKVCKENLKIRNNSRDKEDWEKVEFGLQDGTGRTAPFKMLPIEICERILSWYEKTIATLQKTYDALKDMHKERLNDLHSQGFEVSKEGFFLKRTVIKKRGEP